MTNRDPRVDAYIGKAAEFARPILSQLRELVHAQCPEVEESLKWGAPNFAYHGRNLAGIAAFKRHASFGFWQHAQVMGEDAGREGMGSLGKLASVADLPRAPQLKRWLKRAMQLIDAGVKPIGPRKHNTPRTTLEVPADLVSALRGSAAARKVFDAFAPSHQREYVEWIIEARREQTRARRVQQAIEWIAQGKPRNWKYMKASPKSKAG